MNCTSECVKNILQKVNKQKTEPSVIRAQVSSVSIMICITLNLSGPNLTEVIDVYEILSVTLSKSQQIVQIGVRHWITWSTPEKKRLEYPDYQPVRCISPEWETLRTVLTQQQIFLCILDKIKRSQSQFYLN